MNRFQEYFVFWRDVICPNCNRTNWIYDSHSLRSYPDIKDACKCHECGVIFWMGSREEFDISYGHLLEDGINENTIFEEHVNYTNGQVEPR